MPIDRQERAAALAALSTFTLWGLFPFLFQATGRAGATAWEIVAWRTIAATPMCLVLVIATGQLRSLGSTLLRPRVSGMLLLSATLLGLNWTTYVWAVGSGHTLSASLGYFINPLMNVAAGAILFRERMSGTAKLALSLATVGVVVQTLATGGLPWVALLLAATFCGYSIVRKKTVAEAQTALMIECLALVVPAILYAAFVAHRGDGAFGMTWTVSWLLLAGGPATVIPLMAFGYAARRTSLAVIGFMQFVTPSMLFVVGALQGEPLNGLTLASFVLIWAGVAVFAWGSVRAAAPAASAA